jgi:hypothetical protein
VIIRQCPFTGGEHIDARIEDYDGLQKTGHQTEETFFLPESTSLLQQVF